MITIDRKPIALRSRIRHSLFNFFDRDEVCVAQERSFREIYACIVIRFALYGPSAAAGRENRLVKTAMHCDSQLTLSR